jgi:hypothetical protein
MSTVYQPDADPSLAMPTKFPIGGSALFAELITGISDLSGGSRLGPFDVFCSCITHDDRWPRSFPALAAIIAVAQVREH